MHLVHLTASSFFGGPERQMLGLAKALPDVYRSTFLSFAEGGRCAAFLDQTEQAGFEGQPLCNDMPRLRACMRELATVLRIRAADVLICHGYKSNLLGRIAARRAGVPIVSVSRGWTGENVKVQLYEKLDRLNLRFMDAVVAVSEGQAQKVLKAGVPAQKLTIIRNAARLDAFRDPIPHYREKLKQLAGATGAEKIIVAAGRLSPEKGFAVLVDAAAEARKSGAEHRFVIFGDGKQRISLENQIAKFGLKERVILAGFQNDLDRWIPWADVVVLPSFTEGLPNVALEASAAGIPVVATAVGGTPEVVRDGETGYLVPPGNPVALSDKILSLCRDEFLRRRLGEAGQRFMHEHFSFAAQADAYQRLFTRLVKRSALAAA